jgi:hypothetical protein
LTKFVSLEEAVGTVQDNMSLVVGGFGSFGSPEELLEGLAARYASTGHPRNITAICGITPGDKLESLEPGHAINLELNRLRADGLIGTVLAGNHTDARAIAKMVGDNKIAGYLPPMGVMVNLFRTVAGGRPGQEGDVRIYDLGAKTGRTEDGVEILDGVSDPKVLVKHLFDVEDSVLCLAITPDGKTLAAGGCDRAVRIFDLSEGIAKAKLVQTVENHADWVLGCTLTPDGKYLVTAGRDKTAKVWDLKTKESVVTFPEHQNIVYAVAVKSDGSAGFSVGADKQIRTWKPSGEGKQVKAVGGHGDEIFKIVANPKKPMLATSSAEIVNAPRGMPLNSNVPARPVVTCSTPVWLVCGVKRSVTIARAAGVAPSGRSTRPAIVPDAPSRTVVAAD